MTHPHYILTFPVLSPSFPRLLLSWTYPRGLDPRRAVQTDKRTVVIEWGGTDALGQPAWVRVPPEDFIGDMNLLLDPVLHDRFDVQQTDAVQIRYGDLRTDVRVVSRPAGRFFESRNCMKSFIQTDGDWYRAVEPDEDDVAIMLTMLWLAGAEGVTVTVKPRSPQ